MFITDLKNLDAPCNIWPVNGDLPIEPPWPEECRVQHIRPIGGGKHNDTAVASEAIHLRQELINGLLPLVITPTKSGTTLPPDGINLINEDNAGRLGLGLLEEVAHPGGTDTDEELDELRGRAGEEGHPSLPSDGTREEGLPSPRRTNEEAPLGDLGSERGVLIGVLKEINDLLQLELGLVRTSDVEERDARLRHLLELALGAAEVHGPAEPAGASARPALRAAEEEEEAREGEEREEEVADEGDEAAGASGLALGDGDVDAVGGEDVNEVRVVGDHHGGAAAVDGRQLEQAPVLGEAHALDFSPLDGGQELAVPPLRALGEVGGRRGGLGGCQEGGGEGIGGRRGRLGLELGRGSRSRGNRGGGRRVGGERGRGRESEERRTRGEGLGEREPRRAEGGRLGLWERGGDEEVGGRHRRRRHG